MVPKLPCHKFIQSSAPLRDRRAKRAKDADLSHDGVAPAGGSPAQFGETIRKEIGTWRKIVADAGVKVE